jgi:hypothetical protein
MMKVWMGPEMEGKNKGELTMFVKSKSIGWLGVSKIMSLLRQNPLCKRLYLGAGRTNTIFIANNLHLREFCSKQNIKIIIEANIESFRSCVGNFKIADQVIIRFYKTNLSTLKNCDMIKLDDGKEVLTVELIDMVSTDLNTLDKDTFSVDKVLYDSDKEKKI